MRRWSEGPVSGGPSASHPVRGPLLRPGGHVPVRLKGCDAESCGRSVSPPAGAPTHRASPGGLTAWIRPAGTRTARPTRKAGASHAHVDPYRRCPHQPGPHPRCCGPSRSRGPGGHPRLHKDGRTGRCHRFRLRHSGLQPWRGRRPAELCDRTDRGRSGGRCRDRCLPGGGPRTALEDRARQSPAGTGRRQVRPVSSSPPRPARTQRGLGGRSRRQGHRRRPAPTDAHAACRCGRSSPVRHASPGPGSHRPGAAPGLASRASCGAPMLSKRAPSS